MSLRMPRTSMPDLRILAVSLGLASVAVMADDVPTTPPAVPFAQPPNFDQPTAQPAVESAAPVALPPVVRQPSREEQVRTFALTRQLRAQGDEAFSRGLLPLSDYVRQLDVATEVEVAAAGNDARVRRQSLEARSRALQTTVQQLGQFAQPAAKGWRADVAEARFEWQRAQLAAAAAAGRDTASLRRSMTSRAKEFLAGRVIDYRVGLASPAQLERALTAQFEAAVLVADGGEAPGGGRIGLVGGTNGSDRPRSARIAASLAAERRTWSGVADITQPIRGAREDSALMHDFQGDFVGLLSAVASEDPRGALTASGNADAAARRAFALRLDYYGTGTASLADLSHAWTARSDIQHVLVESGLPIDPAIDRSLAGDLGTLVDLARSAGDTRGRIAADVAYVESLAVRREQRIAEARAREAAAADASRNVSGDPPDGPGTDPAIRPRVIEIPPN